MASSLQTLIKILDLEEEKGFQNKAVIGGFARFAHHWAREAHSQAKTEAHHGLVNEITEKLCQYETAKVSERPALIEEIVALAKGQKQLPREEAEQPRTQAIQEAATDDVEIGEPDEVGEEQFLEEEIAAPDELAEPVEAPRSVRERRGYAWRQVHPLTAEELALLDRSVDSLKGVAQKRAQLLERLGVQTIRDLLYLFPRRYDDYSRMKLIGQLKSGEEITVIGVLEDVKAIPMKRGGKRVEAFLADESGRLRLNWFNQPWMEQQLEEGEAVVVSGKVEQYMGRLVMNSPEVESLEQEWLNTGRVVPVYPLTEGLSGNILRRITKDVIDSWAVRLPDPLSVEIRERADLMDYGDAIGQAHFPDSLQDKEAALSRLAFDELLLIQLSMLQRRYQWQSQQGTPLEIEDAWLSAFEERLPYRFTGAQQRAIAEIRRDIASQVPMNRLLQGDVGSGKTVVAALAMGIAVANGVQAVLMAPTTILAEQHYTTLSEILAASPLGGDCRIALLTSNVTAGEREAVYAELASGQIQVVIGTHALIQPEVQFAHLGLAVIDEQHRFGVIQRGSLRAKAAGGNPHLLVMTATPIPRTLALTLHADLDLTIIDEMPPGRQPVGTRVLQPKERERAYAFIRGQIEKGRQAYIIYPLVEESDKLEARAAVAEYERLQETVFPDLRLGLLHGRMRPDEKEAVMAALYQGEIDILVSTTVIEVGIDVPNATIMMVENANRFGLAQLHQLRGRVGRGEHESYCLLISDQPFLDYDERLQAMEETNDGFRLAEIDWELRGAGDLLGTQQSGFGVVRYANLMDSRLIEKVQREARTIYEHDPELLQPEHQGLAHQVSATMREGDIS